MEWLHINPRRLTIKLREDDCGYVWRIEAEKRCMWVKNTLDCQSHRSMINYGNLFFCTIGTVPMYSFFLGLGLLLIWLLYLFVVLGSTADNFFCPPLAVIATMLHMSENIAGVTILAFGNGSPDIFTSLVSEENDYTIMYTELLGAGLFVTTVIAGTVALATPLRVVSPYLFRDLGFYFLAIGFINFMAWDHKIRLWEAATLLGIYGIFIVAVVIMQKFENRGKTEKMQRHLPSIQDPEILHNFVENREGQDGGPPNLPELAKHPKAYDVGAKLDVAISREEASRMKEQKEVPDSGDRPEGLVKEFLYDVNPMNGQAFQRASLALKILMILRLPSMFFLQLLIPVVNETAVKRGWSRLLNCLQLFYTPLVFLWLLGYARTNVYKGFPLIFPMAVITSIIAASVFFMTNTKNIPKYHNIYAILGFISSMMIVYLIAQEVVGCLQCIGWAAGLADALLGIILLAWGNSTGDLISNVAMARRGYPRMGFAACFGGPLFNTLMGLGITLTYATWRSPRHYVTLQPSTLGPTAIGFIAFSLITSCFYLCATYFVARRSYAYALYSIYLIFLLFVLLSFMVIIHPLGTDHRPDEYEPEQPESHTETPLPPFVMVTSNKTISESLPSVTDKISSEIAPHDTDLEEEKEESDEITSEVPTTKVVTDEPTSLQVPSVESTITETVTQTTMTTNYPIPKVTEEGPAFQIRGIDD